MERAVGFILLTLVVYEVMKKLYVRFYTPLLLPIVTTTGTLVAVLLWFQLPYQTYMEGGKWIGRLLGPAVVALAFPLYHHRQTLKRQFWPIFQAVCAGAMIAIVSGACFSVLFHLNKKVLFSLLPKSVTSPIAMDIAKEIGGIPALAAVYVMIAGIFGAVFGPPLLRALQITHPLGVGIALGSASHGVGTAKALEIGKEAAAISSIAMTLSAILAAFLCPLFVSVLL
ncbi:LrgB family protein [Anoxybacillus rupiensis]|uniref:LrgB family protein n=1 Tax=Anoxybacteroides rupiense TaxID=311460 RepID=A0ABD5ITC5_9BACL|nr:MULTISPECIES: LrgB family protein [Anoxybacillus]MBB3907007.1 putative murein hydrolase (TIGR00659 family) [Anoxybacillus rupiensis]MBS2771465.1 LrgB family protein [Anoxybacillus rupiensis]MDE8564692.1 LrgB family protein [Anoxybacillus rupiensis]MED5051206.1 LrgB family protein [Anoxybacillus rupiensis]QHC05112.1 LrgB family protein [Anoxybacillus sp. PDR2]